MTIRKKTLAALGVTLATLVAVLLCVLALVLDEGFAIVERSEAERNMLRLREAFANETDGLCEKTVDWSAWDDTYRFVEDRNAEYIAANIAPTTFEGMHLGFILIFDHQGNMVLGAGFDPGTATVKAAPSHLAAEHFGLGSPWIQHPSETSVHSGVLLTSGLAPAIFCSQPILTTEGRGPVRGAVVFGRFFEGEARKVLARLTRLDLAFAAEGEPAFSGELAAALARLPAPDAVVVEPASETQLVGFTRFQDAYGKRSLVARAIMPRDIHAQAEVTLRYVLLALVVVGLGFALVVMVLLERVVLGRLATLSQEVARVTRAFDFSARVTTRGQDEIGTLGAAINSLLAAAEQVSYSGGESEAKYSALQQYLPVALAQLEIRADESGRVKDLLLRDMTDAFAAAADLRTDALGRSLIEALALPAESAAAWTMAAERARTQRGPLSFELRVGAQAPRVRITVVSMGEGRILAHLAALPNDDKSERGS